MSSADYLWLVYYWLPIAFAIDFTLFGVYLLVRGRFKMIRTDGKRTIANAPPREYRPCCTQGGKCKTGRPNNCDRRKAMEDAFNREAEASGV